MSSMEQKNGLLHNDDRDENGSKAYHNDSRDLMPALIQSDGELIKK